MLVLYLIILYFLYNAYLLYRAVTKYQILLIFKSQKNKEKEKENKITDDSFQKILSHYSDREYYAPMDQVSQITEDIIKESSAMISAGPAILIQVLHPKIGSTLIKQSSVNESLVNRFDRTFKFVFKMTFGSWEEAKKEANKLWMIHKKHPNAMDENATIWVFYTLLFNQIMMYELMVRNLTIREKNQFIYDSRIFASLYGIHRTSMPHTWDQFLDKYCNYLQELSYDKSTIKEISHLLFRKPYWESKICLLYKTSLFLLPNQILEKLEYERTTLDYFLILFLLTFVRCIYNLIPIEIKAYTEYRKLRNIKNFGFNNLISKLVHKYFE